MLVLFETPAGYALFKTLDDAKLKNVDNMYQHFQDEESAKKMIKFKGFAKFEDTTAALEAATSLCDGELGSDLKKFLKKSIVKKGITDKLAVADGKLGNLIKEKLGVACVHNSSIDELYRGIRSQLSSLLAGLPDSEMKAMTLGLAHSLSRHKIKFSPDKVDTMIIQAIALLDELDKELNTYAMRVREWYGWHFPEMAKILNDTIMYARVVQLMGMRSSCSKTDFSALLDEEVEAELKDAAEISMGTEISDEDLLNIVSLCNQVVSISEYRASLFEYLKNRMNAIAPNLSVMVGELVGARLIAHSGSLINLAKCPASTVQILGAEKALFRALKTKHDTPKYGLIYHASLVGQAGPKNKGKVSRVLAGKTALAARVDALGDADGVTVGYDNRAKVEERVRILEGGRALQLSGRGKTMQNQQKYEKSADNTAYDAAQDICAAVEKKEEDTEEEPKKDKKSKKEKKSIKKAKKTDEATVEEERNSKKEKKSVKKSKKADEAENDEVATKKEKSSKKSKKRDRDAEEAKKTKKSKKSKTASE